MKVLWGTILLAMTFPVLAAGNSACVLPVADGQGPTPSRPSFRGEIIKVSPGLVTVQAEPESKHIEFQVNDNTQMFTGYGGIVSEQEFAAGLNVSVWYIGCDISMAGSPPVAAVVRLDFTH